jgi:sortase A
LLPSILAQSAGAVETQAETQTAKTPPPIQPGGIPRFEDDPGAATIGDPRSTSANNDSAVFKQFMNLVLLLVEVAAVVGLLFIGYQMLVATDQLEAETREAQKIVNATAVASIPTLAPTPVIRLHDVVLPTGHIVENGVARPNFDEIPERYREQLRYEYSQPVLHRPEPTDNTALRVSIPALKMNEPITQGDDWEALKAGVAQVLNGFDPARPDGNVALAAHNDVYGQLFRDLDQLKPGDQIFIQTRTEVYTYEITHTEIVEPTEVSVLDSQGRPTVVLISCYPFGRNNKRIVVFANRVDSTA